MTSPYILHYAPDNASLVVRLALEELNQPYETALVDRRTNAHKSPAYLKLNPHGVIPALDNGSDVLFETAAILLWLADTNKCLAPSPEAPERAPFLSWLFFTSNTFHADLRKRFYPAHYVGADAHAAEHMDAQVIQRLTAHLGHLENIAATRPSWLHPDTPSVMSLYLACLLRWMKLYPAEADNSWFHLPDHPALHRILLALETRHSVRRAQGAEGLGPAPFTWPCLPDPPEGSAT